jgi:UPF0716 family protein affecting phage T7 exclusion
MSNAVAGVTGAMVTLGVVAICAALAFFLLKRRAGGDTRGAGPSMVEKGSHTSGSISS